MSDVSYLDARDVAQRARSFDAFELAVRTRVALTTPEGTERLRGESVTPGYFGTIGVGAALGRLFTPDEFASGAPGVILLGHGLWQRKFGGRPDIVGSTVVLRGSSGMSVDRAFTVVGVLPPRFVGTVDPDVSEFWLPVEQYQPRRVLESRTSRGTWVIARLKPGLTASQANDEVRAIGDQLAREHPAAYRDLGMAVESVGESWRSRFRDGIALLTGTAVFLLLIACANIAHLLLARLAQREHEMTLRVALGATRAMLMRQLLIESAAIAVIGGAIGVALAAAALRTFQAMAVFALPPYVTLTVDARIAAAAIGLMCVTAVLGGALPAWLGSRVESTDGLRASRGSSTQRQRRTVGLVVAAEVAFSFLLLVGSALMIRSYANLTSTDVGFRTENLLRLAVSLDATRYSDAASRIAFARDARAMLEQQPGVRSAAFVASLLPPWVDDRVRVGVGGSVVPGLPDVTRHGIDDQFFSVMDIPIIAGRGIVATDDADGPRVAVVSEGVARAIAGGDGRDAIDRTVALEIDPANQRPGTPTRIVGIVEDVRYEGVLGGRRADHDIYVPLAQASASVLSIAVHTTRDPALLRDDLVRALGRFAPTSPLHWISTMEEELALQFRDARLYAWLTGIFGASALSLVLIGIYGVLANAVARRMREIGVRMAIGATPTQIVRLVLAQAALPVGIGVVAGATGALLASRFARTLVYGLTPDDPSTFVAVAVALLTTGLLASALPARRATRLDPSIVLRRD
jgi:putative ABC transport system permease protein